MTIVNDLSPPFTKRSRSVNRRVASRPAIKSLRDQWEAAAIRQFEADRRAYIRRREREEAAKAKAQKRKRET